MKRLLPKDLLLDARKDKRRAWTMFLKMQKPEELHGSTIGALAWPDDPPPGWPPRSFSVYRNNRWVEGSGSTPHLWLEDTLPTVEWENIDKRPVRITKWRTR